MKASKFKAKKKTSTNRGYTPAPKGKKVYISKTIYILNGYVYSDGYSTPICTEAEWYADDGGKSKEHQDIDKELIEGDWGPSWREK